VKPLKSLGTPSQQRPDVASNVETPTRNVSPNSEGRMLWAPPPLRTMEDTGLSRSALEGMVLKALYFRGEMLGHQIAEYLKLPFAGILDTIIESVRREKLIEVAAGGGMNEATFRYLISGKGIERALEVLDRTTYSGPAPVPLEDYISSVKEQNKDKKPIREDDMRNVMKNLIVSKDMLDKIGPAANSGTSIFLYGPPGNGKTTLSEAIGRVILGEDMWIPYSIDVDGQIIQMLDEVNHELSDDQNVVKYGVGAYADARWIRIKRPIIIVGGELNMASLDLTYDPVNKFYEAPYQVKANGGMLLNRWIVPLEKKYDFLTLANGRKIEMPFTVMIIFSTNMDPRDLVDDAFLRRIKYKIEVGNPTAQQFRELFELMCKIKKVPFNEAGYMYLLREWYQKFNRDLRFVHPRDLLSQMKDIADYMDIDCDMKHKELLDRAAASYFVEL
jgi:predicted ATPase with chaperone activity